MAEEAYRSRKKRQRCLTHLIRKTIAIAGAVDQKAAQIGQWILTDLRKLIETIVQGGSESSRLVSRLLSRLCRVCHLGQKAAHAKLRALAREIRLGLGSCRRFRQPS
jgi:hypothetical protein